MLNQIEVKSVNQSDRSNIIDLLRTEKLPVEDLPESLDNFFVATDNNKIIGAIGLELYDKYGLLRSLIVNSDYRNQHVAGELIKALEKKAAGAGLSTVYLLTETAPLYFEKKGYARILRDDVPDVVKQSSEFRHVCPTSAIVMKKSISK